MVKNKHHVQSPLWGNKNKTFCKTPIRFEYSGWSISSYANCIKIGPILWNEKQMVFPNFVRNGDVLF